MKLFFLSITAITCLGIPIFKLIKLRMNYNIQCFYHGIVVESKIYSRIIYLRSIGVTFLNDTISIKELFSLFKFFPH